MAYRIPRERGQRLRDYPTYTIPEAAFFLGMSRRTLHRWILEKPLWKVSGAEYAVPLLSFRDIAQVYYVELIPTRIQGVGADVTKLYPWRYWIPGKREETPVTIDPEIMSGRLVITGTRIPVQVLLSRKNAGESVQRIANDYDLSAETVNLA